MPTYYFHLRGEGFEVPDLAGRECADDSAARAEAERLAAEIIENALISGEPPLAATVEVDDEELRPLLALPLVTAAA
jgi:hypothetical protein